MRVEFTAKNVGFDSESALVGGVLGFDSQNNEHYLMFQKDLPDEMELDQDANVYLEFDDQNFSGCDCFDKCRVSRTSLTVNLTQQLGDLENVSGFDVALEIDDDSFLQLANFLENIFRESPDYFELIR